MARLASLLALGLVLVPAGAASAVGWQRHAPLPAPRTEVAAAAVGDEIVVAGGVVSTSGNRLARSALTFDPVRRRWSVVPGPTPREHLGVTSLGGVVYAVAGRTSGLDTNLTHVESYRPGERR